MKSSLLVTILLWFANIKSGRVAELKVDVVRCGLQILNLDEGVVELKIGVVSDNEISACGLQILNPDERVVEFKGVVCKY